MIRTSSRGIAGKGSGDRGDYWVGRVVVGDCEVVAWCLALLRAQFEKNGGWTSISVSDGFAMRRY